MLKIFTRFALSLATGFIATIILALLLGASLPANAHASLFSANPCPLPCVFGVTPGVTLRNEAMMTLEQQGMSYSFLSQNQSASFTTRENRTAPQSTLTLLNFGAAGDMRVTATFLYQMAAGNELGVLSDFLLAGYQPTRVYANCQNAQRLYSVFEQLLMVQVALEDRIEAGNPVMMVASARDAASLTPVGGFACATVSAWQGFAPLWKYQALS